MKLTSDIVIQKSKSLGFDLVGFTKAEELVDEINRLEYWLDSGYQSGMSYMERNIEKRKNVKNILPSAKSVISLGLNYYTNEDYSPGKDKGKTCLPVGKVSRYAWGKDYHLVIWEKLEKLENALREIDNTFESISYTDTGPVMDKVWAQRAGLGWIGKHTNIINKEFGSWIFLATIITNYDFDCSAIIENFCGSCTACIEACPTDAIVQEYVVDANKCISNLTIENKGEIPGEFKGKFDNWLYGCDICQDVCPWNVKFSVITGVQEFFPQNGNKEISLSEASNMESSEFKVRFKNSSIKRTKLKGIKRNAEFLKPD